jgi:hypothetical protein
MKELSIEEKAKRYDEALEKSKILYEQGTITESLCYVFPELKKNEDEKIRNELLLDIPKVFPHDKAFKYITWLEKQGEQKHETPIPRFNIGDWVIAHNKDAYQVIGFNTYDYRLQHYLGGKMNYPFKYESDLKPWTIQDAKDGDVLVTENKNIFIFKSISNFTVYDYCGLYFGKFTESSASVNGSTAVQLPTDYVPATKEQRDTLIKAMKEAGYEWDAEKKELKKIEFSPDDYIEESHQQQADDLIDMVTEKLAEWSEEDEEMHRKCICAMRASACGFPEEEKFVEQVDNWFKSLKDRYTWKPSEKQMEALKNAIHIKPYENPSDSLLWGLYEQLKKLREE